MKKIKERQAKIKYLHGLLDKATTANNKSKIDRELYSIYEKEAPKIKTVGDQFNEMFGSGK